MAGNRRTPRLTLGLVALSLLLPPASWAKILKYVDRNGNIHVVDDESLIPPEYRPDTRMYSDPESDRLRKTADPVGGAEEEGKGVKEAGRCWKPPAGWRNLRPSKTRGRR